MFSSLLISTDATADSQPNFPKRHVTNEWLYARMSEDNVTPSTLAKELKENCEMDYAHSDIDALRKKCADVARTIKAKKTRKKRDLPAYLQQEFLAPKPSVPAANLERVLQQENNSLKRKLESKETLLNVTLMEKTACKEQTEQCLSETRDLLLQHRVSEAEKTIEENEADLKRMRKDLADVPTEKVKRQTLAYRNTQIETLRENFDESKKENAALADEIKKLSQENDNLWRNLLERESALEEKEDLEQEVVQLRTQNEELRRVLKNAKRRENTKTDCLSEADNKHQLELNKLKERIEIFKNELQSLHLTIEDGPSLETFKEGKYTDNMRQCVMELVTTGNVSLRKVPTVIKAVTRCLLGKEPSKLPSTGLISAQIMPEARFIANKQVCLEIIAHTCFKLHFFSTFQAADEMLKDFDPTCDSGITLNQDATTKFHRHFEGMQVCQLKI